MVIPKLSLKQEDIDWGTGIIKQYSALETYPVHTHDFYEIFYISRGKGLHYINGKEELLTNGSLVYIRPDDVHSFKGINYFNFEIYSLGFTLEELTHTLEYLELPLIQITEPLLPIHLILEGNNRAFMEQQLNLLLTKKEGTERKLLFRALLPQLLYFTACLNDSLTEKELIPKWLANLDEEMSKRENYIMGLPRMLELCSYSQEYMNRVFKKYFKITPTEYINAKRLIYATELLVGKQFDIIDICYMTGFNNLSYFYSVFKKQYNCTPKQFLTKGY